MNEKITEILTKYENKWQLSDFKPISNDSITGNQLFTCHSAKYGPCVLKLGAVEAVETEYLTLKHYENSRFCQIYEAEIEASAFLLQHIIPGIPLRAVVDLNHRLDIFFDVFSNLHTEVVDREKFPTYLSWVSRIMNYMHNHHQDAVFTKHITTAYHVCMELWKKYPNVVLLHGDLHHDNILLGADNQYRIIDPKGVLGNRVFDIPRFIINEFDDVTRVEFDKEFEQMIQRFSKQLAIPVVDVVKLVYMEICLSQCWSIEDGEEPSLVEIEFVERYLSE